MKNVETAFVGTNAYYLMLRDKISDAEVENFFQVSTTRTPRSPSTPRTSPGEQNAGANLFSLVRFSWEGVPWDISHNGKPALYLI